MNSLSDVLGRRDVLTGLGNPLPGLGEQIGGKFVAHVPSVVQARCTDRESIESFTVQNIGNTPGRLKEPTEGAG
ncbi:hypothetical protein GCM10009525_60160 [Streptosporangium amethystogenes subsp. fukuiense]